MLCGLYLTMILDYQFYFSFKYFDKAFDALNSKNSMAMNTTKHNT